MAGEDSGRDRDVPEASILGLQTDKSGLPAEEKERIDRIIFEASRNSRYFRRESDRDQSITQKGSLSLVSFPRSIMRFCSVEVHLSFLLHRGCRTSP